MKKVVLVVLLCLLVPRIAHSKVDIVFWDERIEIFKNIDCQKDNSCSLKEVWINIQKYRVVVEGGLHFGTVMTTGYKTDTVEALEEYGFVQFIRGCKFASQKNADNTITNSYGMSIIHFGERKTFAFPEWVIDSDISDPVYTSRAGSSRAYYGLWLDNGVKTLYGNKKPATPELFIIDHPGRTAFFMGGGAQNTSLELRTCIYKTKDVPGRTTPDNVYFARPIKCFTWNSIFVYNHDVELFESTDKIDPFCESFKQ